MRSDLEPYYGQARQAFELRASPTLLGRLWVWYMITFVYEPLLDPLVPDVLKKQIWEDSQ